MNLKNKNKKVKTFFKLYFSPKNGLSGLESPSSSMAEGAAHCDLSFEHRFS